MKNLFRAKTFRFFTTTKALFKSDSPFADAVVTKDPFSQPDLSFSLQDIAQEPFPPEIIKALQTPVALDDIEVKPDGILYIPEIKYRRALTNAFGPGGWGLIPLGNHTIVNKTLSREYALFCKGRFVSQARGEQDFFGEEQMITATEGVKSNAMVRCCKDLGIFWELWDPKFIRSFKEQHVEMVQGVHYRTGASKWLWKRKGQKLDFPYKEK